MVEYLALRYLSTSYLYTKFYLLDISITEVITKQSEIVRERYFQKVEEQGAKAPLKMLIPMMLFVLPCIFLIIFTPLIIQGLAAK